MLPIDAARCSRCLRPPYSRHARVIGWGTGSVFDYFHGLYPIRLDYLVDNDRTRWGQQRRGIEIASPERLLSESSVGDRDRHLLIVVDRDSRTDRAARSFHRRSGHGRVRRSVGARKVVVGGSASRSVDEPMAFGHEHGRRPGAGHQRRDRSRAADPDGAQSRQSGSPLDVERHASRPPRGSRFHRRPGRHQSAAVGRGRSESEPADRLDARGH